MSNDYDDPTPADLRLMAEEQERSRPDMGVDRPCPGGCGCVECGGEGSVVFTGSAGPFGENERTCRACKGTGKEAA